MTWGILKLQIKCFVEYLNTTDRDRVNAIQKAAKATQKLELKTLSVWEYQGLLQDQVVPKTRVCTIES